ncbi:MAG: hypothetical protein ABIJ61_12350 [bacterium]
MKIIMAALLLGLATQAQVAIAQPTAESVIAAYFESIGGEENLLRVKSLFLSGTTYTQSLPLEVRLYIKPPNKAYNELLMEGQIFSSGGTDGNNAWQSTPLGTFFLDGDLKLSAQQQADFFPLLDYRKRGMKLTYLGETFVKGKKSHKIQVVTAEADTSFCYFDDKDHFLLKQESRTGSVLFSKYRPVGNLVIFHKLNTEGAEGELLITFDSIAVNIPIPDSLFVMPADAEPLPEKFKP